MSTRDDPHEPSTSTASQRREEDNRKRFERIFSKNSPPTLWTVCTTKQRGRLLKCTFASEVRALRGVNFKTLLKPFEIFLTDLSKTCGTTFHDLCHDLKFLAFNKIAPATIENRENSETLFKLVANCIIFSENSWTVVIDKGTLMDSVTVKIFEGLKIKTDVPSTCPILRLQNDKEVPLPPPHRRLRRPFQPMDDEFLREMHSMNDFGCNDPKFNNQIEKLMKNLVRNNMAIRTKEIQLSDCEYYGDDYSLGSAQISFRIENIVHIVDFKLPVAEDDGYFPPDRSDHAWYLFENYQKSNTEVTTAFSALRTSSIRVGFERCTIFAHELLRFHSIGRHIHGFFNVWRETGRGGWRRADGRWIRRRYLVDIYNQLMFPLYVDWSEWPASLRWAFDKVSLYGLKLMTMVRKHSKALKSVSDTLFSRYPTYLHECLKSILMANKARSQFFSALQVENSRSVEKSLELHAILNTTELDDGRKRRRRTRKSDDGIGTTPQKTLRTPRKSLETSGASRIPSTSSGAPRTLLVQKKNVDKLSPSPPQPTTSSASVPTSSTVKRRLDDVEQSVPAKKVSLNDSWDEQGHNQTEEEHVDEGEDPEDHVDSEGGRTTNTSDGQNVWVPQDRGFEVAPEQYAREILEHYIPSEVLRAPQTTHPTPKPRKSRKPKPSSDEPEDEETSNGVKKRLYSVKTGATPVAVVAKTVYPVKKLSTSTSNGTTSSASSKRPIVQTTATNDKIIKEGIVLIQNSIVTKAPYFPAGMRPKLPPPIPPVPPVPPIPLIPPVLLSAPPSPKAESPGPSTPTTPPVRAIQQHELFPETFVEFEGRCRRAMSFNDQMMYKHRRWEPKVTSKSPPETILLRLTNNSLLMNHADHQTSSLTSNEIRPDCNGEVLTSPLSPIIRVLPRTTTTAYTVLDHSHHHVSIRSYTTLVRKQHTSLTPEELGDAVRHESRRFRHESNGGDGPTVKSFLMNLKS